MSDTLSSDSLSIVPISNRPPVGQPSGGAMVVIDEGHPKKWIGPLDHPDTLAKATLNDNVDGSNASKIVRSPYNTLTSDQIASVKPTVSVKRPSGDKLDIYMLRVPRSLQKVHYEDFSNGVVWPVLHGMNPREYSGGRDADIGDAVRRKGLEGTLYNLGISVKQLDAAYEGYTHLNQSLSDYQDTLAAQSILTPNDVRIVHDYQMAGVKGDMYFSHIPWPPLDVLKKYTVNRDPDNRPSKSGDREYLINTGAWKGYVESLLNYKQLAFQRPQDMQNFLGTLEYYGGQKFRDQNPELYQKDGALLPTPMGLEGASVVHYGDRSLIIANQVVGTSLEKNLAEAKDNEHTLSETKFRVVTKPKFEYDNGEMDANQAKACGIPNVENLTLKALLSDRRDRYGLPLNLLTAPGHNLFLSFHRNDYTKSTTEKLEAIQEYFHENPDRIGKDHFVIFAQPTRLTVNGYKEYAKKVIDMTKMMREGNERKHIPALGDSLLLVPAGVKHPDLMGLARNKNVAALVSTGRKDGCDLTQDEVNHANYDRYDQATGIGVPLANITTDGTGAAEKYTGTVEKPIGYIVRSADSSEMSADLVKAFKDVSVLRRTEDGLRELAERNGRAMKQAAHFTGRYFNEMLLKIYQEKALPLAANSNIDPTTILATGTESSLHGRAGSSSKPFRAHSGGR